ncbi:MAG: hypothetical protein JO116_08535 [Planctomycetaceae bacterium]|nr:hypothetical protein [Planctomycetaceae bacterium]
MKTDRAAEGLPERIRPELNVEKWSIWRPANSRGGPRARTFERDVRLPDGTRIVARLKVAPTTEGNLTTEDQRVYYALVRLWEERGRSATLTPFSLRGLARVLKRIWNPQTKASLTRSLLRLRLTGFIWEQAYIDGPSGRRLGLLDTFSILSDLKIVRRDDAGHVTREEGHFRFHAAILQNLLAGHTKPVRFDVVLAFKSEVAQLVYSHIDLVLSDKANYERRTAELFEDLGLEGETYQKPSKRREKLEPALKELQGVELTTGRITKAALEKTRDGADYKLVVRKGESTTTGGGGATGPGVGMTPPPVPAKDAPPSEAEDLVRHFHRVFHGAEGALPTAKALDQAADLIARLGMERARHVIDFAHREAPKTKHRVATFGGVLQYATAALHDFERRATAEATARAQQDQQEQARRATARAQAERDRVQAYWEALPPERRAALDAAALDQADPADRVEYEAAVPSVRRMLRTAFRAALIRRLLGLPAAD